MNAPETNTGLRFRKMHGLGNDFVIVDGRGRADPVSPDLARAIGDRHRGVGFDQLAVITDAAKADAGIVFWNSDGSTAGACGNATRCVAHLLMEESGQDRLALATQRGTLLAERAGTEIRVNMGQPQLAWADIPLAQDVDTISLPIEGAPGAVGMGNPHMVFAVDAVAAVDVAGTGAALEHHPLYPEATNVEFCEIVARDRVRMRVWERGAGITLACGSGACAAVVALARQDRLDRRAAVELDGGTLLIDWRDDGVWMTGPIAYVFDGVLRPDLMP